MYLATLTKQPSSQASRHGDEILRLDAVTTHLWQWIELGDTLRCRHAPILAQCWLPRTNACRSHSPAQYAQHAPHHRHHKQHSQVDCVPCRHNTSGCSCTSRRIRFSISVTANILENAEKGQCFSRRNPASPYGPYHGAGSSAAQTPQHLTPPFSTCPTPPHAEHAISQTPQTPR